MRVYEVERGGHVFRRVGARTRLPDAFHTPSTRFPHAFDTPLGMGNALGSLWLAASGLPLRGRRFCLGAVVRGASGPTCRTLAVLARLSARSGRICTLEHACPGGVAGARGRAGESRACLGFGRCLREQNVPFKNPPTTIAGRRYWSALLVDCTGRRHWKTALVDRTGRRQSSRHW